MKLFYIVGLILGTALPYSQLVAWLGEHGLDFGNLLSAAAANPMAAFAWLDVLIAALVLAVFVIVEGRRIRMGSLWLPLLATAIVGVSCGLPLFLLMRQRHMKHAAQESVG